MNNRITGDFGGDAIEAFRVAYAASLSNPEDHDVDPVTQMPTNVVSNTSPWIRHTGLWKANDGMSRDFKPNQPFNPDDYFGPDDAGSAEEPEEETMGNEVPSPIGYEPDGGEEVMTEGEFQSLADEIWDDEDDGDGISESPYSGGEIWDDEDDGEDDELDESEIEELINEILGSTEGSEDDEDEDYETDE